MPRKHNNAEDLRHCLANCLKTEKNKAPFFLSNPIHTLSIYLFFFFFLMLFSHANSIFMLALPVLFAICSVQFSQKGFETDSFPA